LIFDLNLQLGIYFIHHCKLMLYISNDLKQFQEADPPWDQSKPSE